MPVLFIVFWIWYLTNQKNCTYKFTIQTINITLKLRIVTSGKVKY